MARPLPRVKREKSGVPIPGSVVVVFFGFSIAEGLFERVQVEVQLSMVFWEVEFIDGPARAHRWSKRVALKVRK